MMHVVGVDVSKKKLDCALYLEPERNRFRTKVVANDGAGFAQLLEWACHHARCAVAQLHLVLEATGVYHEAAALAWVQAGARVSVLNPARVREFAHGLSMKSKTDALDRVVLARYGVMVKPPPWQPPPPEALELQSLIRRLEGLESDRQRTLNRLEQARLGTTAAAVLKSLETQLAFLEEQQRQLQREIDDHIDRHPRLQHDAQLQRTIPSVGDKTAARMVALFHAHHFRHAKQAAAYLGLDVIEHLSGTSVHRRARISKAGPARIRAALYMPAVVAIRHNPDVAALYQRLLAKGKPKKLALAAAMRKLVHICFGVWKNQIAYQPQNAT